MRLLPNYRPATATDENLMLCIAQLQTLVTLSKLSFDNVSAAC